MEAKNGSTRTAKESELKQRQFQFESISFEIDQQRRYWSNRLWLNFKKFLIKIYFFFKRSGKVEEEEDALFATSSLFSSTSSLLPLYFLTRLSSGIDFRPLLFHSDSAPIQINVLHLHSYFRLLFLHLPSHFRLFISSRHYSVSSQQQKLFPAKFPALDFIISLRHSNPLNYCVF